MIKIARFGPLPQDTPYEQLPRHLQVIYSRKQWAWLGDTGRTRVLRELEPESSCYPEWSED